MKIYAFIDSQNLNLSIREQGWILDFARFRIYLKEKYKVEHAFIFIGFLQGNESLYTASQKMGFILVFKPTMYLPDGTVKGNVDAELVLHSMIEYNNYDRAIIVTGDGDFHCLVKYFYEQSKLLRLFVPNRFKYSRFLRKAIPSTNFITFMNDLRQLLEYKKHRRF